MVFAAGSGCDNAASMKNIVILISGGGSNMAAIVRASQQERWAARLGAQVVAAWAPLQYGASSAASAMSSCQGELMCICPALQYSELPASTYNHSARPGAMLSSVAGAVVAVRSAAAWMAGERG